MYHLADNLPPFAAAALDALPPFPERQERLMAVDAETACTATCSLGRQVVPNGVKPRSED